MSQNYDNANAVNGPTAYYQDNRITVTGSRDLHGQFNTVRFRLNFFMIGSPLSSKPYFPFSA